MASTTPVADQPSPPGAGAAPPAGSSFREIAVYAVWFAMVAVLGELAARAVKKLVADPRALLPVDLFWMAPLADLVFFFLLALGLWGVSRLVRRPVSLQVMVAVLGFGCLLSWGLLAPQKVHLAALVVLLAGVAVTLGRLAARWPTFSTRLVRATVVPLVAVVLALAVGAQVLTRMAEARALAALPPAAPEAANVLVITMDTVRAQSCSVNGYERPTTPRLEAIGRQGAVFTRALAPAPWTLPTHASLFTGLLPHQHHADFMEPLDSRFPTLAERLAARGYRTGGFVANTLYCGSHTGLGRGFARYQDYSPSLALGVLGSPVWRAASDGVFGTGFTKGASRKSAAEVNAEFIGWLDKTAAEGRPFFAFLNYFDAHGPYFVPDPQFDKFSGPPSAEKDAMRNDWMNKDADDWQGGSPEEVQLGIDTYEGSIAYIDHQIGLLLDTLAERGLLDDTLVIITSDHGEHFGEHQLFGHARSLYRQELQVPVVLVFPVGIPSGRRIAEAVSLRDLPATIESLVAPEAAEPLPGRSLASLWSPPKAPADDALAHDTTVPPAAPVPLLFEVSTSIRHDTWPNGQAPLKSVVVDGLQYIVNYGYFRNDRRPAELQLPREEIYDFDADPLNERNLIDTPRGQEALPRLRARLNEAFREAPPEDRWWGFPADWPREGELASQREAPQRRWVGQSAAAPPAR